jgi:hypothetical protein
MTAPVEVPTLEEAVHRARATTRARSESWLLRLVGPGSWAIWANLICVLGVIVVTLSQLHPSLLFAQTTTAGGDTGAHVALPAFLKNDLLPEGRLTGWDPGWYDGFPLYTFYFPLPGMVVVLFNVVFSYDVAFKLVTVLGSVLLPICAWAFGRLSGLRDPLPACLAAATLPFLFEPSFTIYGGNLLSTLAGEFSFSLSLSIGLLFLGVVCRGLRTGRYRVLAGVLFAITLLCHLIPALFVGAGAVVWLVLDADVIRSLRTGAGGKRARRRVRGRVWWALVTGFIGLGLTAWWLVPFGAYQAYTTNMGYTNVFGFPNLLFPEEARWVLVADAVGLVAMVLRRNRVALFIVVMGGLSAAAVCLDPQGKLYNVRFLPFWFLCIYLMAGYAVGEVVAGVARWYRRRRLSVWAEAVRYNLAPDGAYSLGAWHPPVTSATEGIDNGNGTEAVAENGAWRPRARVTRRRRPRPRGPAGAVVGPLVALFGACLAVVPPFVVSASTLASIGVNVGPNQPSAWADWNYAGYEEKPDYPEYHAVIQMMSNVGAADGCGRAMWEYDPSLNRFGTTESLMLLPYWTNGCIDSMEGLLFESSSTTPFHFLNQSELSDSPSDAVVGLPYSGLNVTLGIRHLQQLGVRYFLASSSDVEAQASADPSLTLVDQTGPWDTSYNGQVEDTTWKVYRIDDSPLVTALSNQPVVWHGVQASQKSWLAPAVSWYDDPARWDVVPAAGGPTDWPRVPIGDASPRAAPEPPTQVTAVRQTNDSVSFHVDRVGTPVEVKISYFPNWQASGALGPWRVAPNLMVVVPTSHDVTLRYGTTVVDYLGQVLSLAALAVAIWLGVRGWRRRRAPPRAAGGTQAKAHVQAQNAGR